MQQTESTIRVQTLDETVCVSLHANAIEKGMSPAYLQL